MTERPFCGRRLTANFLSLSGGECVAKLLTFAAFAYLGRVLGPQLYGGLEFVLAAMVFFTLPVDFGLGTYGARELASDRGRAAGLLREVSAVRLVLACLSYSALAAAALIFAPGTQAAALMLVYGLCLFAEPVLVLWFFQGHDRMPWVAAAGLTRKLVFAALVFTLIRPGTSLVWVGACEVAAAVAAATVTLVLLRRLGFAPPRPWVRPAVLASHLRQSAPIGLSELAWALLWYCTPVLMGLMVGGDELGWFGAGHRVVMALHTFVWLYFFNLLPSLARSVGHPRGELDELLRRSLGWTAWGGVGVAMAATLTGRDLLTLAYGESFAAAATPFAVLAWVLPVALVSGHYRYTLIAYQRQRVELGCTVVSAVVAVVLGLTLIPRFGAVGAAAALVAGNVVNLLAAWACVGARVTQVGWIGSLLAPTAAAGLALLAPLAGTGWGIWLAAGVYLAAFGGWAVVQLHRPALVAPRLRTT